MDVGSMVRRIYCVGVEEWDGEVSGVGFGGMWILVFGCWIHCDEREGMGREGAV